MWRGEDYGRFFGMWLFRVHISLTLRSSLVSSARFFGQTQKTKMSEVGHLIFDSDFTFFGQDMS